MKQPLTVVEENGAWTVRQGSRYRDELGADEALWIVANYLMGREIGLRTREEHAAHVRALWGTTPLESWQKLLPLEVEHAAV